MIWLLRPCVLQWLTYCCRTHDCNTTTSHNIKTISLTSLPSRYNRKICSSLLLLAINSNKNLIVVFPYHTATPRFLQLLASCNVCIVVSSFDPSRYDVRNVVVVACSSRYDMKKKLIVVVASHDQQSSHIPTAASCSRPGVGTNYLELIALRSQLIGIAMEVYTWNCNSSELQPKELQSLRIAACLVINPLSPRSYWR